MHCNVCGSTEFVDMNGRKGARCAKCGSLERTRLLWLYFQEIELPENASILHLAPEKGMHDAILKMENVANYVCADFDPARYRFANCVKMDLCQLDDQPSLAFDLIIHSHVLEHTPCNIAYTLFHLHRMLTPGGIHLCVIPFLKGEYDECFQDIGNDERTRRFGQFDHVRRFGSNDIASHLGKLLKLPDTFDATTRFAPELLRESNIPEAHWRGFHISTVLQLTRSDMTLIAGG